MKTLLILLIASSLFAQTRKRQTTEYLTIEDYAINNVVQKPFKIGYLAYTPDSYYLTDTVKYPLIIACHGNGQKGTLKPDMLRNSFVAYKLDRGMNVEAVVISPQTNGWKPKWGEKSWYKNLLDTIIAKYRIDTNEIYVMGYSGGGEGVCTFVKNYPCQGIATFAPVITLSTTDKCPLVGTKVWGFHCLNDATIRVTSTQNLIKDIVKCPLYQYSNTTPKASYYPSGGHDGSWQNGLKTDSLFRYLLK
jgi:predicted peptidase